jgi:hypothetical protein
MAQTIARILKFEKKRSIWNHPYRVYKTENKESWFWASFTENYLLDFPEKELESKLILMLGNWERRESKEWSGWVFKCRKSYLLSGDFLLTSWDKKENENLPEKKLREVE